MKNPGLWSRPIQIVVTRLLHVTLTTLHQYFGLSGELLKKVKSFSSRSFPLFFYQIDFIFIWGYYFMRNDCIALTKFLSLFVKVLFYT